MFVPVPKNPSPAVMRAVNAAPRTGLPRRSVATTVITRPAALAVKLRACRAVDCAQYVLTVSATPPAVAVTT